MFYLIEVVRLLPLGIKQYWHQIWKCLLKVVQTLGLPCSPQSIWHLKGGSFWIVKMDTLNYFLARMFFLNPWTTLFVFFLRKSLGMENGLMVASHWRNILRLWIGLKASYTIITLLVCVTVRCDSQVLNNPYSIALVIKMLGRILSLSLTFSSARFVRLRSKYMWGHVYKKKQMLRLCLKRWVPCSYNLSKITFS